MNSFASFLTGMLFEADPEPVPGPATNVTLGEVLLICSSILFFLSSAGLLLSGEDMHVSGGHVATKVEASPVLLKVVITRWNIIALLAGLVATSAGLISPELYKSGASACCWAILISPLMLGVVIVLSCLCLPTQDMHIGLPSLFLVMRS